MNVRGEVYILKMGNRQFKVLTFSIYILLMKFQVLQLELEKNSNFKRNKKK